MHVDRRLVGFGLFLITIGAVMVAVRQNLLSEDAARQSWTLWPLLLVGVGLSIILAGRPGAAIGGLLMAVTFGAMLGGVAATGTFPGNDRNGATFPYAGGDLGAAAEVSIEGGCGDLTVGTVAGTTWGVSGTSDDGRPPKIDRTGDRLKVAARDDGPFDLAGSGDWTVVLPRDATLRLDIEIDGGRARIALAGATLDTIEIDANAGSVDLDLRDAAALREATIEVNFGSATVRLPRLSFAGELSLNAGSAALCLPDGVGLRVRLESVAASDDFAAHGLVRVEDAWETPGFTSAGTRIDLRADANAGSLALNPARSCAG